MLRINLIALVFCFTLVSCHNIVGNKDPIFDKFKPESKEYKDKLAEKIKENPNDIDYYLNNYHIINNNEYLEFNVEGNDFKAIGFILVKDWKKMQLIKKNKATGYCGAEFGLQLDVISNPDGAILVYKDLDWIID